MAHSDCLFLYIPLSAPHLSHAYSVPLSFPDSWLLAWFCDIFTYLLRDIHMTTGLGFLLDSGVVSSGLLSLLEIFSSE